MSTTERVLLIITFASFIAGTAFQQLTIYNMKGTIAIQSKTIDVQDNNIAKLKNALITVSESNADATIAFCDAIDKYRRLLGLTNEHFGKKAREIKNKHNYDEFK